MSPGLIFCVFYAITFLIVAVVFWGGFYMYDREKET